MQRSCQDKYFWIDAICIQQANIRERNHQVAMMGDVYTRAAEVIVWLGAEDIPFRGRGLLNTIRRATLDPNTDVRENELELNECLIQLAKKTYWTRAWVLQEFVLAAQIEIRYGSTGLPEDLFRLFWTCKRMQRVVGLTKEEIASIRAVHAMKRIIDYRLIRQKSSHDARDQLWHSEAHRMDSLEWLSEEFAQARCSDPRDRIYSLLSLTSPDLFRYHIVPDYAKTSTKILGELVGRYCCVYPVFRIYQTDTTGFGKVDRMMLSALELEARTGNYNPSDTILTLESEELERGALLWAIMLEIGDPERACRTAIRKTFIDTCQRLFQPNMSPVATFWNEDSSCKKIQWSGTSSVLEMDQVLHSKGLLASDTSRGFVDWIKTCSERLWAPEHLSDIIYLGASGERPSSAQFNKEPA